MAKFSKGEAIKFGWDTTLKNIGFFILLFIVYLGVQILTSIFQNIVRDVSLLSFVVSLISWVVGLIIGVGLIKIALSFVSGKKAKIENLFQDYKNYPLLFNYFLGTLATGVIILAGLVLLIIPGIFFAVRLQFVTYFIVDKNLDFISAIKASWKETKGQFWNLFILGIIFFLVMVVGLIALLVGLFVAVPTILLAHAFVYRKISR